MLFSLALLVFASVIRASLRAGNILTKSVTKFNEGMFKGDKCTFVPGLPKFLLLPAGKLGFRTLRVCLGYVGVARSAKENKITPLKPDASRSITGHTRLVLCSQLLLLLKRQVNEA